MVAIVDYGVGNLLSLRHSFMAIGQDVIVTDNRSLIRNADRVVLPGVGAFADAAQALFRSGMDAVLRDEVASGKPVMGICLGMQLLFEKSFEYGEHSGLALLKGEVVPMEGQLPSGLKIPHIGWNALHITNSACPLFRYIADGECVYFVHSYYASGCEDSLAATAEYGVELTAAVYKDNLFGCQFHPEKSEKTGLAILRAFCETEG